MPDYLQAGGSIIRSIYGFPDIMTMMKKGDSAVTIQLADRLIIQQGQLPPNAKIGDQVFITLRILEVFPSDSLKMADYNMEIEKDKPRQIKEQKEQITKMQKEQEKQQLKEI